MSSLSTIWCGTSTNSGNALALTPSPAVTSYITGQVYTFLSNLTTSGTVTINISGLGAKALHLGKGPLTSGDLVAQNAYEVLYDGAAFQLLNKGINLDVRYFGAVGDGTTDDTTAIQAAITVAEALGTADEGAVGSVYAPAGYTYRITSSLIINTPIQVDFRSYIDLDSASPTDAVIIGASAPVSGKNTGYRLYFSGLRDRNGNTALPTGVNSSGTVGIRVHNMQFSSLELGTVIAFTNCGIFLDCQDISYSPQNVQDNNITLGQIAYNGIGLNLVSQSGTSSAGANRIAITNIFGNFINLQLDNSSTVASTSNTFRITAMDAAAPNGTALSVYAAFNSFDIGYLDGAVVMQSNSFCNTVTVRNNISTGVVLDYGGQNNWITAGPTNPGVLPTTVTITSGAVTRNSYGVPIVLYFSALISPNTSSGAYVNAAVGASAMPSTVLTAVANASSAPTPAEYPFTLLVAPGYYWSVTSSNTSMVALSGAVIQQASQS